MEVVLVVVGVIWLFSFGGRAARKTGRRIDRFFKPRHRPRDDRLRPIDTRYATPAPTRPTATPESNVEPFDARTAKPRLETTILCGAAFVIDGDSLVIQKTQIRLFGVDAPEINHPYGIRAKQKLWAMCKNHSIRAEILATDAHGRTVARCILPDGRDLSAEMVKAGLALDWAKFSGGIYRDLELPDARRKMWLADARQKGRMHVWARFDAKQEAEQAQK